VRPAVVSFSGHGGLCDAALIRVILHPDAPFTLTNPASRRIDSFARFRRLFDDLHASAVAGRAFDFDFFCQNISLLKDFVS
jgi:hypothetical protein